MTKPTEAEIKCELEMICKELKIDMPEAINLVKKMKNMVVTELAGHLDEMSPQDLSNISKILERYND